MTHLLKNLRFFWLTPVLLLFLKINEVLAAKEGGPVISGELTNPLKSDDIIGVLNGIFQFLAEIGVPLLAIFISIGGFQILTAAGSPEKIKTGKDTILYATIGYIVVLCAWGVIYIIEEMFSVK